MAEEPKHMMIPYIYERPVERERPATRVEVDAFERMRDLVAWLRGHGVPASVEQEMTIAMRAHVAGMAARLHNNQPFPERDGDLKPGRLTGVHRKPRPEVDETEDQKALPALPADARERIEDEG